mgnify:CR=1 FL=1
MGSTNAESGFLRDITGKVDLPTPCGPFNSNTVSNFMPGYSPGKTKDALVAVASERAYHPVKQYLEDLPEWDNVPRIDRLLTDYFGAEDNRYTQAVMRKYQTLCPAERFWLLLPLAFCA